MLNVTWTDLENFTLTDTDITSPWLMAAESLGEAAVYLRLKTEGAWTPLAGLRDSGPDGLVGQTFPDDQLLLTDCSLGALIGKFGGSSAALKNLTPAIDAGESKPFAVGTYAIAKIPDKFSAPLFLGFNILRRPFKLNNLKVAIAVGR